VRGFTPATAQTALPHLRRIAEATGHAGHIGVLARVLARVDPGEGEPLLRDALVRATDRADHRLASTLAGELIDLLQDSGRLPEALDLADTKIGHTRLAGLGPWTRLADQGCRLRTVYLMGHPEQVLTEATRLGPQMAQLPEHTGDDETGPPWTVRERILNLGTLAATDLHKWETALTFTEETLASLQQRGAGDHDIARARLDTARPLLEMGQPDRVEDVLRACQRVFDTEKDLTLLARTLAARARLASRRGHHDDATALQRTALRLAYARPRPWEVATFHDEFGLHLTRGGADTGEALAHHLAAALIHHLIGDTRRFAVSLRTVAAHLHADPDLNPPANLADLAAAVEYVDGVHYTTLISTLIHGDLPLTDQVLADLIAAARSTPPSADT
jgi:hypothetical protein